MAENDPNKNELNPGDHAWNNKFGESGTPSALHDMETSGDPADKSEGKPTDDFGNAVRGGENTNGAWDNNVTGKQTSSGGIKGFGNKAKVVLKKKGATALIIALLGGGAAVPFLGAAALPFSIVGNQDAKSMMHGLGQYSDDYNGFRLFRSTKTTVSTTSSKIKGLTNTEIAQLEKSGIKLEGASKNPVTNKTTFSSIKYDGQTIHAGNEFKATMRTNTAFRKAMVINKGSYWKSAKSDFASKVKTLFKIDTNPDLSGKTTDDKNKKLYNESVEGSESRATATNAEEKIDEKTKVDPNEADKASAKNAASELNSEIEAEKTAIKNGHFTTQMANDSNMGNVGAKLSQNGVDITASQSISGKVLGSLNVLSPLTMVCTMYQAASTANTLARTVALFNIVRFSLTIRATIEKAKAGDDDGQSVRYLMDLIQRKDPTTGQSFDGTSYAAFLFSGQLSGEPSAVSSFGGKAMIALYLTMHSINSVFGQLVSGFTLGGLSGSASNGRRFLKDACKVATNVGVQVVATGLSFVAAIFTGGGSGAAQASLNVGLKQGFKAVTDKMVKVFGKDAIKDLIKKEGGKLGAEGTLKYMARNSWKAFSTMWVHMSAWDKVGLLVAGVSTFGMGYIVNAIAGGNIAGFMNNGFSAFDALGTGWNQYESVNGIASGGNMATYAQAAAYQPTAQTYNNAYVADMRDQAKDTPLDLKTPYSSLGSVVLSMQKMIGISASLSLPSTLAAVAALPFKLPTLFTAHADAVPTPEKIGAQVGNPYYESKKLAVTVTGSPQITFTKHYTFQDILDKLVDSPDPQISYDGTDEASGSPILTVIDHADNPDGTLSLSHYIAACHNPDRTEPDPEFSNDDESNVYNTDLCIPGGKDYKEDTYPLYDDAVRFLGQVNPDAAEPVADNGSAGTSTEPGAGTSGRDDVPAKFKSMAQACLRQSGKACTSSSWIGMLPGQCAAFAAWRAVQQWYGPLLAPDGSNLEKLLQTHPLPQFGSGLAMGNGIQVAANLIASGMASPVKGGYANVQPGDIVSVRTNNAAGHVFVILSVSGGVITVEDYNAAGGPGKYGTKKTTDWPLYNAKNITAIARVHVGGGNK